MDPESTGPQTHLYVGHHVHLHVGHLVHLQAKYHVHLSISHHVHLHVDHLVHLDVGTMSTFMSATMCSLEIEIYTIAHRFYAFRVLFWAYLLVKALVSALILPFFCTFS